MSGKKGKEQAVAAPVEQSAETTAAANTEIDVNEKLDLTPFLNKEPSVAEVEEPTQGAVERKFYTVHGGDMIDPFAQIVYSGDPRPGLVTNWLECQIESGRIKEYKE